MRGGKKGRAPCSTDKVGGSDGEERVVHGEVRRFPGPLGNAEPPNSEPLDAVPVTKAADDLSDKLEHVTCGIKSHARFGGVPEAEGPVGVKLVPA